MTETAYAAEITGHDNDGVPQLGPVRELDVWWQQNASRDRDETGQNVDEADVMVTYDPVTADDLVWPPDVADQQPDVHAGVKPSAATRTPSLSGSPDEYRVEV
jgi:hypothetical protein